MHWWSGVVLAVSLGVATGAASCPRDQGERQREALDARRSDPPAPAYRYEDWSRRTYRGPADEDSGRHDDGAAEFAGDEREDHRYEDRYGPAPAHPSDGVSLWYRDGRRPHPMCPCPDGAASGGPASDIRLSSGFFSDTGGVGPIPLGGDGYGGRYTVMAGGSAFSRAYSSAQARSSATVIVRRGGSSGGHGGKRGGMAH